MHPLQIYIRELRDIRYLGAGVRETSFYPALSTLLNAVGKSIKPRVRCIINLQNKGAGLPDGGLFTPDQFQRTPHATPREGQLPSRGAIEVKGTAEELQHVILGEQVQRYCERYGLVLVTNLRGFALVSKDEKGTPRTLEVYRLAESEAAFWSATANPEALVARHGDAFLEYLKRVMQHAAPLAAPKDVAWFLASYARDAKARIEDSDFPALAAVRSALEEALGLRFEGERGDHFFRSTLVQTLFYGVFSAWVLWSRERPLGDPAHFDWRTSAYYLRVPILRKLFHEVAEPGQLEVLTLPEVLDWTGTALNRVDRAEFFSRFDEGQAVQYFYEPFLEAFDPELRRQLGVWYTPVEIVRYMVARVDRVLRDELGLPDGLADPNVYILDPCCGTGAYLVEVLKSIAGTLREKGGDALLAHDLKRAVLERVFGFELLPAPFVVAHLQLGLLLQSLGAPLSSAAQERASIYLTNALTGWEPPQGPKKHLLFPELEAERDAADRVKQQTPILVVLGNPPYNGFAGVAIGEERDLSDAYRSSTNVPAPQGKGLNELYVRFFRMAERRIVEKTGKGVVCFISNYSWLDGLSFTGMRERYLGAFDRLWIDNLHGDRRISEYAPDGRTSETVFAMEGTSPGIRIGTAISLMLVKENREAAGQAEVLYRDFDQARATERRAALLDSLVGQELISEYRCIQPVLAIGLPFKPSTTDEAYCTWPLLTEVFPTFSAGVLTCRDDALVDVDRDRLTSRMVQYFDPAVPDGVIARLAPSLMEDVAAFKAAPTRKQLLKRGFLKESLVRYCYRPFDVRWLYWEPETKLLDRNRADYRPHVRPDNFALVSQQKPRREWSPPQAIRSIGCLDLMDRGASCFPLYLAPTSGPSLFAEEDEQDPRRLDNGLRLNLTDAALQYLHTIGAMTDGEALFFHTLAVLHAPAYAVENSGALRQDWPRVPLPHNQIVLKASSLLGREVAALLDSETPVSGVTVGTPRAELRVIATITRQDGAMLRPDAGDLDLTAGWGHGGRAGIVMPAKGHSVEREYAPFELDAIRAGAEGFGLSLEDALAFLGTATCDIYLNEVAYWKNVPINVWDYSIGGYQVLKKWLSYREQDVLGRSLKPEEVREVMNIARRIAALLLLEPRLDTNYQSVKQEIPVVEEPTDG